MKLQINDGICGHIGVDADEVELDEDTFVIGYVSKIDEEGYASEFKLFDSYELADALNSKDENRTMNVRRVQAEYQSMTTLMTPEGVGIYPTYILPSTEEDPEIEIRLFIKHITRNSNGTARSRV